MCVDNPPCALTDAEMQDPGHLDGNAKEASYKLLPKPEGSYCVLFATDTVFCIIPDSVTTSVSIYRVTKLPTGSRVAPSSATGDVKADSEAAITKAATGVCATVQDSKGAGSVRKDEEEYFIKKLVRHNLTEKGMQYRTRWYGYSSPGDTQEPVELLAQLLSDRYWQAVQKKRPDSGRLRRP